jgi:transposase-like protein
MSNRRKFGAKFKREAVPMATMPGVTLRDVAKDPCIGESVLGRWNRDLASHIKKAIIDSFCIRIVSICRPIPFECLW